MGIDDLFCYSDSMLSINLIQGDTSHYHVYAVLVQDIKDLMTISNFSIHHTLRECNQSVDFMAKLGAASDIDIIIHSPPPFDLMEHKASRQMIYSAKTHSVGPIYSANDSGYLMILTLLFTRFDLHPRNFGLCRINHLPTSLVLS